MLARAELALTSARLVRQAYDGIDADEPGELIVGVRVDDYPEHVGEMLDAVDDSCGPEPRFGGWALHDLAAYVR